MAQHTGNFLFLIYLGYFFLFFSGGDGPPEGLRRQILGITYIGQVFPWYITLLLFTLFKIISPEILDPKSRGGILPHDLYSTLSYLLFDCFSKCWFLMFCIVISSYRIPILFFYKLRISIVSFDPGKLPFVSIGCFTSYSKPATSETVFSCQVRERPRTLKTHRFLLCRKGPYSPNPGQFSISIHDTVHFSLNWTTHRKYPRVYGIHTYHSRKFLHWRLQGPLG